MAGPQHQPTAKPLSRLLLAHYPEQKNKTEEELFCLEVERKKMPDPEEDPAIPSAQKSTFKPVDSDQFQMGTRNLEKYLGKAIQRLQRGTIKVLGGSDAASNGVPLAIFDIYVRATHNA